MMHLNTTPPTNRVNPAELRALRAAVAVALPLACCVPTLLAGTVATAALTLGEDWSQEADYLVRELAATAMPASLTLIR